MNITTHGLSFESCIAILNNIDYRNVFEHAALWAAVEALQVLKEYQKAVEDHFKQRGHKRCWENDRDLYLTFGLDISTWLKDHENLPPIEEHKQECDRYRKELYNIETPTEQSIDLLEAWRRINADKSGS